MPTWTLNPTGTYATGTIQSWTAPSTGSYTIETYGAQGGTQSDYNYGGRGAKMVGTFDLVAGDVLKILVGQRGVNGASDADAGGGGGTFVVKVVSSGGDLMSDGITRVTPLIIAGGGGGDAADASGADAPTTEISSGNVPNTNVGYGAQGGTGGGGGGYRSSGISQNNGVGGGGFLNADGAGGAALRPGGFGGGAGGNDEYGAGGGGYTGGNGVDNSGTNGSGGGGSYNIGTNQANVAGARTGDGMVVITSISSITGLTSYKLYASVSYSGVATDTPLTLEWGITTSYGSSKTFTPSSSVGVAEIGPLSRATSYNVRFTSGSDISSNVAFTTKDGLPTTSNPTLSSRTTSSLTVTNVLSSVNE
jgi:hypothetical protein